jgi:hypothetical protein
MNFEEIAQQIAAVRVDYQSRAQDMTAREIAAVNAKVKELTAQLVASLTEGAKPCPNCSGAPHGLYHGEDAKRAFEVGCLACAGVVVGQSFRARANSREGAVARWNAGPERWEPLSESQAARASATDAK